MLASDFRICIIIIIIIIDMLHMYALSDYRITQNFDEQNFEELLVGFKGEALREEDWQENFDESLTICQIRQKFSTIKLLH